MSLFDKEVSPKGTILVALIVTTLLLLRCENKCTPKSGW